MSLNLQVTDMAGASPDKSTVITNFVNMVYNQLLSPSTAKYDRTEKKDIYRTEEVPEYWIIDIRKRSVELYELDYEGEVPKYFLIDTVTKENKKDLRLIHFPNIQIDFEQLFDGIE